MIFGYLLVQAASENAANNTKDSGGIQSYFDNSQNATALAAATFRESTP